MNDIELLRALRTERERLERVRDELRAERERMQAMVMLLADLDRKAS